MLLKKETKEQLKKLEEACKANKAISAEACNELSYNSIEAMNILLRPEDNK